MQNTHFYSATPNAYLMDLLKQRFLQQNPSLLPLCPPPPRVGGDSSSPHLPSLVPPPPQKFFEPIPDVTIHQHNYNYPPKDSVPVSSAPSIQMDFYQPQLPQHPVNTEAANGKKNHSSSMETNSDKKQQVGNLHAEISRLKKEQKNAKLKADERLNSLLDKNSKLSATLKKMEKEYQTLSVKAANAFKQNLKISSDNDKLVSERDKLVLTLTDLRLDKSKHAFILSSKSKEISEQKENHSSEISRMKTEFEKLEKEKQQVDQKYREKCRDFEELQLKYNEIEVQLNLANSDCRELTGRNQALNYTLNQKDYEISGLTRKCENLDIFISNEISKHQEETAEFAEKIKNMEENTETLEAKLEFENLANASLKQDLARYKTRNFELDSALRDQAESAEIEKKSYQTTISEVEQKREMDIAELMEKRDAELQKFSDEITTMRIHMGELINAKYNLKVRLKKRNKEGPKLKIVSSTSLNNRVITGKTNYAEKDPKNIKLEKLDSDDIPVGVSVKKEKIGLREPEPQVEVITLSDSEL